MVDVAEYAAPGYVVGMLAERAVLTAYLTKLLEQCNSHLRAALER